MLSSGQLVDSIDDLHSEFIEGISNFLEDSLVGEVLLIGQSQQGEEDRGVLHPREGLHLLNLGDCRLDHFGLDQRWICQTRNEVYSIIDCFSGLVVLLKLGFECRLPLLPEKCLLMKALSIIIDIFRNRINPLLDLVPPGHEQTINQIL